MPIQDFTVKISNAPPDDPAVDVRAPVWAGVIPLTLKPGKPQPAPDMDPSIPLPSYLKKGKYIR
jgi:hypothetical protein